MRTTQYCITKNKILCEEGDGVTKNVTILAMNFRQSLEYPGDTPVLYEENDISNTQYFNRRIVASVLVPGTQANDIEVSNIDEQRRVTELVTNIKIAEMIHNKKQCKNVLEGVVPDLPEQPEEFKKSRTFISSERHSNTTP